MRKALDNELNRIGVKMIRLATMNDLEKITAIYNQAIESRKAVGDTEIFTTEQRKPWLDSHNDRRIIAIMR